MTMDQSASNYALPPEYKYPESLIDQRLAVQKSGTFREKITFGLFNRPSYAFGLLTAADIGKFFGFSRLSVVEFGVADGAGLLDLCNLASQVTTETGVSFDIYGFDRLSGLPKPRDHRDHPEIWSEGDFPMSDPDKLREALPSNCRLVIGDIDKTLPGFLEQISPASPIGFASVDVDIYTSSRDALRVFNDEALKYLPAIPVYFDDLYGRSGRISSLFRNQWSGQMLALNEFNQTDRADRLRRIDVMHNIGLRFPMDKELWINLMYMAHILDHPLRNRATRTKATVVQHGELQEYTWPFA